MVTGGERVPMRAAVVVRQVTRRPLVLLGDDGQLLGVVGEHELYRGMLRQTELAKPIRKSRRRWPPASRPPSAGVGTLPA